MADLTSLINEQRQNGRLNKQSEARRAELVKRQARALNLARTALMRLHKDDYDDLYRQAKEFVDAEAGPLPE